MKRYSQRKEEQSAANKAIPHNTQLYHHRDRFVAGEEEAGLFFSKNTQQLYPSNEYYSNKYQVENPQFPKHLHDHRYTLNTIPNNNNDGSNKIAVEDDINDIFVQPLPTKVKRSVSTTLGSHKKQEHPKKSYSMNNINAEEKTKKKNLFSGFRNNHPSTADHPHNMSRAAMAVIQHNSVDQLVQPPTRTNSNKLSQFLSRASSTTRKRRDAKIVNMHQEVIRDESVCRTVIYVQPDSLHQLLKQGGNGVNIPYKKYEESLSSSDDSIEGAEFREDERMGRFPTVPQRSRERDYYSPQYFAEEFITSMTVDEQLDELIQTIKNQQRVEYK